MRKRYHAPRLERRLPHVAVARAARERVGPQVGHVRVAVAAHRQHEAAVCVEVKAALSMRVELARRRAVAGARDVGVAALERGAAFAGKLGGALGGQRAPRRARAAAEKGVARGAPARGVVGAREVKEDERARRLQQAWRGKVQRQQQQHALMKGAAHRGGRVCCTLRSSSTETGAVGRESISPNSLCIHNTQTDVLHRALTFSC